MNNPKPIAESFKKGQLKELLINVEHQRSLTKSIKKTLPSELAKHLMNASINEKGELVLIMDSPVWAARVRYYTKVMGDRRVMIKTIPHSYE
ncbi:MAG: hypothetical protein CMM56_01515 [Rhodospirillaceae bacterium]|nr:hypothetical protein [Rhodospirillaceae bacterium]|tara:strand:- start:1144 stop:1419 length:276 start_codon:yes stop_codon:yes gene_type:complete